jgi:transcriptional regulator
MTLYVPPLFAIDDRDTLLEFVEKHSFGTLVASAEAGLHVSHIPFVVDRGGDGKTRLLGHVARANAQWNALESAQHLVAIFQGPHAYISPTWYVNHPSVPTWNYAVVHAHGKARLMDEAELHELLMRLSAIHESGNAKPWRLSELPPPYVSSMLEMIVGFEIEVERLEGKFKLSQNRPAEVPRVIAALEEKAGEPELAALMREHSAAAKG